MKSALCTASQYGYSRNLALIVTQNAATAAATATTVTAGSHHDDQGHRTDATREAATSTPADTGASVVTARRTIRREPRPASTPTPVSLDG